MKPVRALRVPARRAASMDEGLDRVFHALGDRTRRSLLARLASGPARVTDLAAPYPMSLNAISKHLKVLEAAGLVARTVSGREHTCALDAHRLQSADAWLDHYRGFWTDTLAAVAGYVESGADGGARSRKRSR